MHRPLFFGFIHSFTDLFDPKNAPDEVVIDFKYTRIYDHSGMETIDNLTERYTKLGKKVHLCHLSRECQALLEKSGDLVEVNVSEDIHYPVETEAKRK